MTWIGRCSVWLLVMGLVLMPALAQAQGDGEANREAARQLGRDALDAFNAGDYGAAFDKFQRAHQLVRLTSTGLYVARSLDKLGRLVEASEAYLEVTRIALPADAPQQHVVAQSDAVKERKALLPRIPQLTIVVEGASDASVSIDGIAVPTALLGAQRPTDPGDHVVEATAAGQTKRQTVTLAEREARELRLAFDPATAAAAPPPVAAPPTEPDGSPALPPPNDAPVDEGGGMQSTIGFVALGIGGAALVVGAITGGLAIQKRGELNDACVEIEGGKACGPDEHDTVDSYNTLRIVSGATLIGGGVIAAAGLISVLTAPSDGAQSAGVTPLLWPGGAGVMGRF